MMITDQYNASADGFLTIFSKKSHSTLSTFKNFLMCTTELIALSKMLHLSTHDYIWSDNFLIKKVESWSKLKNVVIIVLITCFVIGLIILLSD